MRQLPGRAVASHAQGKLLLCSSGVPEMSGGEQTYFQKGFNLKAVVRPVLAQSYHSQVVERLKQLGYAARAGEMKIKLAREFGFCYGVDRARRVRLRGPRAVSRPTASPR